MTREENEEYKIRNIIDVDLGLPLFRVYSSAEWLLQAVSEQAITLVKPNKWDDPFENAVFRSTARTKDGTKIHFSEIEKLFYGLCWTVNSEETDALWRIYSPHKTGVRVKVNAGKLFNYFFNPDDPFAVLSYFIGKVEYKTEEEIKTLFEDPDNLRAFILDSTAQGNALMLFHKRVEFAHEKEVRLIYRANKERHHPANPFYAFGINPSDLFEELLFDPRIPDTDFRKYEADLRQFGFTNPITKSRLYSMPSLNLQLSV